MSLDLEGNMVIDTGSLIELVNESKSGAYLRDALENGSVKAWTGELNIGEIRYLICRRRGWTQSLRIAQDIIDSQFFEDLSFGRIYRERRLHEMFDILSIVDCVTLSAGETMQLPVLFSTHEVELDKEIKKKSFKTNNNFSKIFWSQWRLMIKISSIRKAIFPSILFGLWLLR